jgi:predicted nucleotidyltransferase
MSDYIEYADSEWNTVNFKNRHSKNPQKKNIKDVSYEELVKILTTELNYCSNNIIAGYIYGSRARGTNRIDSDADILIFWKVKMNEDELQDIRVNIQSKLGFSIDFVSCIYNRKVNEYTDERDIAFFENVALDCKQFMGEIHDIMWLAECSEKCKKLKKN